MHPRRRLWTAANLLVMGLVVLFAAGGVSIKLYVALLTLYVLGIAAETIWMERAMRRFIRRAEERYGPQEPR